MDKILRMWGVALRKIISVQDERKDIIRVARSAMLHGGETWRLRVNDMAILRRTEKSIIRAMYGVKLIEKRRKNL